MDFNYPFQCKLPYVPFGQMMWLPSFGSDPSVPKFFTLSAEQILASEGILPKSEKVPQKVASSPREVVIRKEKPKKVVLKPEVPESSFETSRSLPVVKQKNELKTGVWDAEEHQLFLIGLKKFGTGKWKAISEIVGTRTRIQVASHWQKWRKKKK